eukprot:Hpha_TRINITY_DN15792_c4_g3::TRINITY_DN15792_c4_g3_i1::g.41898::m.41898
MLSARGYFCGLVAGVVALALFLTPVSQPEPVQALVAEEAVVAGTPSPPIVVHRVSTEVSNPVTEPLKVHLPYLDEDNTPGEPCSGEELSTDPLTSFRFWGTTMNTSSTCPTSGMNNQMQMLMFYHWCRRKRNQPILKWKDISCSPTGGVHQGGGLYVVGSRSYVYTWFRWSSLFNVSSGGICFSDNYTWSMHPWIRGCGLTDAAYRAFYGTDAYWKYRPVFDYRQSYYTEARRFMQQEGLVTTTGETVPVLAVHLRRGDYIKFCREVAKSFKKLRLAHWKWAKAHGARDVYDKHMDTCFPSRDKVIAGIKRVCGVHGISHVLMATTHPEYLPTDEAFAAALAPIKLHVLNRKRYEMSAAAYTAIDSVLLATASHKLLNRYSTLSLTAVDLTVINDWWNASNVWFW